MFKFAVNLYLTNKKMPKRDRYAIGQRLENTSQDILENIILAINAPKTRKLPYLRPANRKLELLKIQVRMLNEIGLLTNKKYLEFETDLQEAGRMLGGWIKDQLELKKKLPGGRRCSDCDSQD
jgi:four helix bundle protein